MLLIAPGRQSQHIRQKLLIAGADGRTESCPPVDGAGEDYASIPEDITVMGIIIPADHIGEGIVAVHLRTALIVSGE
jgi:hypothetical protein